MFDGKAFGAEVVGVVKGYLERHLLPVIARLDEMDQRLVAMSALVADRSAIDAIKAVEGEVVILRKALADLPEPKDGADGKDGEPGPQGERGEAGEKGEPGENGKDGRDGADGKDGAAGRDGCDTMDAMIDKDGNLIVTFSDGRMKNVGKVCGADGAPGLNGKDGADGVGFDDMTCDVREDGVYLVWDKGDVVKEARLPIPMDRGVFKEGQAYRKGDGVTWGGSFWIAQDETAEKPDSGKGWRLAVKKGRDGKDGVMKPDNGPPKVKV